ncbi:B12-binding domain-containing radical SAM protein [bacterium]|nr:B12-binding domain-containing radical SAM protein [bacterium]
MKITLIQAELAVKYLSNMPPVGVAYLASYLQKNGIEVSLIDAYAENLDTLSIINRIKKEKPDFVGISAVTATINTAIECCRGIKRIDNNIKTILGGHHPSVFPVEILKEHDVIDFVVAGEGENTLLELLKAHDNGFDLESIDGLTFRKGKEIRKTKKRELIKDLDSLPFPAWHLIPYQSYKTKIRKGISLYMTGSRGCPFNCNFCAVSAFWPGQRRREPKKIIAEIKHFADIYDISTVLFFDPMFCLKRDWIISISKEIVNNGLNRFQFIAHGGIGFMDPEMLSWMKKANFKNLQFGLEFGSQKILDLANKKIKVEDAVESIKMTRAAGIYVNVAIMMAYPGETRETIEETIRLAKKLKPDNFSVANVIPYPGTKLYNYCKENGLLKTTNFGDFTYDFLEKKRHIVKLEHLSDADLLKLHKKAIRTIRYSSDYILKTLKRYPKHFVYSIGFVLFKRVKRLFAKA